jgi:aminopeptidase N
VDNLTRTEAQERAALLAIQSYDIELDLTTGPRTFLASTTIRFESRHPGASTFLELAAAAVRSITLNGAGMEPAVAWDGSRIVLSDLAADNVLIVVAEIAYSTTGEGLHRFVDPADHEVYVYSDSEPYDAHRVFPCFDQPDLKATFTLRVAAPPGWTVLGNAPGTEVSPGSWTFEPTLPMSTYLVAVVAGPYHGVRSRHDGIELGLYCRRSLAEHLDADELFDVTALSFDYFHRMFGVRYPWGKYDQAFVPEFNMGAMENAGLVTIQDEQVFRSRVTDAARENRARIIAHEMAHMWFGDLVTLRWWDDLWLNESFAEYACAVALAEGTRFGSAWATFAIRYKAWGYRQDELPSTHPVAGDAPDITSARLNFDGISYAKGAGVLKQLVAWVGREAFATGLQQYFAAHAYGNTTLDDLLEAVGRASGRELRSWSEMWLRTAGVNTLTLEVTEQDGTYATAAIVQSAPPEHAVLRDHRIAVGVYDWRGDRLVRTGRLELDVSGSRTDVTALVGSPVSALLLPNDDDLTWAKIRFDPRSLATLLDGGLARIESPLSRALAWGAAWDMTRDAEMPTGAFVRLVIDGIDRETEIGLVAKLLEQVQRAIAWLGDPALAEQRLSAVTERCRELLAGAEPGSDLQLAYARTCASAAAKPADLALIRGWLEGREVPPDLAIDAELRWQIVSRLATVGALDETAVDAELRRDPTSAGAMAAASARVARPSAAAKSAAWSRLIDSDGLSNHEARSMASAFWQREHADLGRPFSARFFDAIPSIWRERTGQIAMTLTQWLFPQVLVEQETLDRTDALLADDGIDPGLRRMLTEHRADIARALRARERDAREVPPAA